MLIDLFLDLVVMFGIVAAFTLIILCVVFLVCAVQVLVSAKNAAIADKKKGHSDIMKTVKNYNNSDSDG